MFYFWPDVRRFLIYYFAAYADAGVEPIDFPIAPTVALPIALERANLTVKDIALFEINEAFSVVVRIAEKVLSIDPAKINVNGCVLCLSVPMRSHVKSVELSPSATLSAALVRG